MLNYLNNKFEDSSLKIKVELYLLPLFILYLMLYLIDYNNPIEKTIIPQKVSIKEFNLEKNSLNLIRKIETIAKSYKIKITHISSNEKNIGIVGTSSLKSLKSLLTQIENLNNSSQIVSLTNTFTSKKLTSFKLSISFDNQNIKNIKIEEEKIKQKIKFVLTGIIADYVFINEKLIKVNEYVNGYKLIKIGFNSIVLEKDNEKLILKVHND